MRSTRIASAAPAAAVLVLATLLAPGPASAAQLEVFAVTPAFSPFNVAGRTVTIKGVGFTASTTVRFDAAAAAVAFVDSRTLRATVPTVASARVSVLTVSDPANGTDTFRPYFYTGPVIYVATTGNDSNAGTSPAAPKRTVGAGLAANSTGTTPTEVRVAAGRYVEAQLIIYNTTVLSCGWAPGFASRDTDRNVTEIDGNRGGWIIRTNGLAAVSSVDGCTIKNGLRDGFGGGAFAVTADSPVINDNVIVGNMSTTMGGGIYFTASTSYGGEITVSNNVILGNRAHGKSGGALVVYPNYNTQQVVRANISNNKIVGNRSINSRGGGVSLITGSYAGYNNGSLKLADNLIGYNRSKTGGGVDLSTLTYGDTFDLTVNNNLFVGNTALGNGGGMAINGLGTTLGRMMANTFSLNAGGPAQGGGLYIAGSVNLVSTFTATDMILWGNLEGDALGQAIDRITFSDSGTPLTGTGNMSVDPAFVGGPLGSFYLRQADPNAPDSPVVDAGSSTAAGLALDSLTTRADLVPDSGLADLGFHYPPVGEDSPTPISFGRIDPTSGDFLGTDWVLIRGDGFDPGATATFANQPATNVIYLGPTRLLAQPPPSPNGFRDFRVDVRVTNPDATFAQASLAYRYVDNTAPTWISTVGIVTAQTAVDCVRSVVLDWSDAVDADSPPVVYEVYREDCASTTSNNVPCANFGYIPNAANFISNTPETYHVDLNFPASGQDPKVIYTVRARDSAVPSTNKEWNFAKRVSFASKVVTDTTPPAPVGNTAQWISGTVLDWQGGTGAVSYGVYRETDPSRYQNPGTLTKLTTLTRLNNDLNGDGVADTQFTDTATPALGGYFYYRLTSIDPCNLETTSELLP
jgi:hypothetical protein